VRVRRKRLCDLFLSHDHKAGTICQAPLLVKALAIMGSLFFRFTVQVMVMLMCQIGNSCFDGTHL
jgi:hypothetical protein